MLTKTCSNANCQHRGWPQPVGNFHKQRHRKDGLNPWCKDCKKGWANVYNSTDRAREVKRRYERSPKGKKKKKRWDLINAEKYKKDPDYRKRVRARNNVNIKVFKGQMPPAYKLKCSKCDQPADEYHHHNGYDREFMYDVVPVCKGCHQELG